MHKIVNGVKIELTEEEINNLGQDGPEQLLQKAKDKKIAEIKALRECNLNDSTPREPGTYGGNLADKSIKISVKEHLPIFESIISKLERLIESGATNPTRAWTDANGDRLDLTIEDYKSLASHLDLRDEYEYTIAALKIKEVEALTTIEEVKAYDINKVIS